MRHRVVGRQLSRTSSHRKALRRNLAASLIEHGAVRTTEAKAKELRPFIEKLITMARKGTLHARRRVLAELCDRLMTDEEGELLEQTVVQKLFDEIAPRYADRPGGYTRIIRLSERRIGDAGRQVLLQLVEAKATEAEEKAPTTKSRRKKRATKRHEATQAVADETESQEPADAEEEPASDDQTDEQDQADEEPADQQDEQTPPAGEDEQEGEKKE